MFSHGRSMRNSIDKTTSRSLAALTVAVAVFGATVPSHADQNGAWVPAPFPNDGVVRLGLSPNGPMANSFTAYYPSAPGEAKSCAPVVVHHERGDTIDVSAAGSC